jgi:hypothetical protein
MFRKSRGKGDPHMERVETEIVAEADSLIKRETHYDDFDTIGSRNIYFSDLIF